MKEKKASLDEAVQVYKKDTFQYFCMGIRQRETFVYRKQIGDSVR